jgi:hypothetical protein
MASSRAGCYEDRRALGSDVARRVNGNAALRYHETLPRLEVMIVCCRREFDSQPPCYLGLDGMTSLATVLWGVPLMADESVTSPQATLELAKRRAASGIDIRLGKVGGIHNVRNNAAIAEAAGMLSYAGGRMDTSVGVAVAAYFFAAT